MANSGLIDPLRNFSDACRAEAESLGFAIDVAGFRPAPLDE
jgi:hypothetical protein